MNAFLRIFTVFGARSVIVCAVILASGVVCAYSFAAYAQEGVEDPDYGASVEPTTGNSCFDYYSFSSVLAELQSEVSTALSGTSITFSGVLKNTNPYPVVGGSLYVKVFRERGSVNDGNGPEVVDQFIAVDDVVIPAYGERKVVFSWQVPSYAVSGKYELATFFTVARKFNLLGLTFTDDVVGNRIPFEVVGEQEHGIFFDKGQVYVNEEPYRFAAFPARTTMRDPVMIRAHLDNTTAESQRVTVQWSVYHWDSLLRENVVQDHSENVIIPAGESIPVTLAVTDARYPVYLAVATATWKDAKSIIGIRFVRPGIERMRLNLPGVVQFPLTGGKSSTLFACVHNSGEAPVVPDGRLELTLTDSEGSLIHQHVYTGDITAAMMGVASTFTPGRTFDRFVLDARLYSGTEFVDDVRLEYDCDAIDASLCRSEGAGPEGEGGLLQMFLSRFSGLRMEILMSGVFIGLVMLVAWTLLRPRPRPLIETGQQPEKARNRAVK